MGLFGKKEDPEDLMYQAMAFLEKNQPKAAATLFKKVTKIEPENVNGVLITKKLLTKDNKLNCPVCSKRLKTVKDDIYNNKFECCHRCFIEYIEGREDRWLEGWRPGEN